MSEREQNWYPIGMVGWFTGHVREGVEVTAGQLGLLAQAAEPYRLDDATVARVVRVHCDQAADLVLFQNQADRWNAMPDLDAAQRAAIGEYEAAIGELARLNAEVLSAAERLKPLTIEALLAESDLQVGIEAVAPGLARGRVSGRESRDRRALARCPRAFHRRSLVKQQIRCMPSGADRVSWVVAPR